MKAEVPCIDVGERLGTVPRWLKIFCVLAPFLLVSMFLLSFWYRIELSRTLLSFLLTFSAVNLILAGTYFYTSKLFKDNFYFFVACFWWSNAVYLFPQFGVQDIDFSRDVSWLFDLTSYGFLLLALLSSGIRRPLQTTLVSIVIPVLGTTVAVLFAIFAEPVIHRLNTFWMALPVCLVGSILLCRIGEVISDRLWGQNITAARHTLLVTFYAYSILPFFIALRNSYMVISISALPFSLALITKVVNAVAMQGALQSVIATNSAKTQYEMDVALANLRAREAELESTKQLADLGALASSIKHDIQTPLATMSFNITDLREALQHDRRLTRKLEDLDASMDRIHAIVGVVDIIRGDRSFFDREQFMVKVSLLEIAHRAVRSIKNEISELKNPFPKTRIRIEGRDVWVRAYPPMFEQVLVNVIKNGIEAIDEAGRESGFIIISVSKTTLPSDPSRPWARVEIEDNGVGIPEEHADQLGLIFSTKAHKKPNSGIGLFIGIRIVNIHNGRMSFESKVGEGTKVTILLPTFQVAQEDDATAEERQIRLSSTL